MEQQDQTQQRSREDDPMFSAILPGDLSAPVEPGMKAIVALCRCCGGKRAFLTDPFNADFAAARFADREPVIVFRAWEDLDPATGALRGQAFDMVLTSADLHGVQVMDVSVAEAMHMLGKRMPAAAPAPLPMPRPAPVAALRGLAPMSPTNPGHTMKGGRK